MLDIPVLTNEAPKTSHIPSMDLKAIAREIIDTSKLSLRRHRVRLRQGKTVDDLRQALKKARDFGRGRQAFTLAMLEAHLQHLLEPAVEPAPVSSFQALD